MSFPFIRFEKIEASSTVCQDTKLGRCGQRSVLVVKTRNQDNFQILKRLIPKQNDTYSSLCAPYLPYPIATSSQGLVAGAVKHFILFQSPSESLVDVDSWISEATSIKPSSLHAFMRNLTFACCRLEKLDISHGKLSLDNILTYNDTSDTLTFVVAGLQHFKEETPESRMEGRIQLGRAFAQFVLRDRVDVVLNAIAALQNDDERYDIFNSHLRETIANAVLHHDIIDMILGLCNHPQAWNLEKVSEAIQSLQPTIEVKVMEVSPELSITRINMSFNPLPLATDHPSHRIRVQDIRTKILEGLEILQDGNQDTCQVVFMNPRVNLISTPNETPGNQAETLVDIDGQECNIKDSDAVSSLFDDYAFYECVETLEALILDPKLDVNPPEITINNFKNVLQHVDDLLDISTRLLHTTSLGWHANPGLLLTADQLQELESVMLTMVNFDPLALQQIRQDVVKQFQDLFNQYSDSEVGRIHDNKMTLGPFQQSFENAKSTNPDLLVDDENRSMFLQDNAPVVIQCLTSAFEALRRLLINATSIRESTSLYHFVKYRRPDSNVESCNNTVLFSVPDQIALLRVIRQLLSDPSIEFQNDFPSFLDILQTDDVEMTEQHQDGENNPLAFDETNVEVEDPRNIPEPNDDIEEEVSATGDDDDDETNGIAVDDDDSNAIAVDDVDSNGIVVVDDSNVAGDDDDDETDSEEEVSATGDDDDGSNGIVGDDDDVIKQLREALEDSHDPSSQDTHEAQHEGGLKSPPSSDESTIDANQNEDEEKIPLSQQNSSSTVQPEMNDEDNSDDDDDEPSATCDGEEEPVPTPASSDQPVAPKSNVEQHGEQLDQMRQQLKMELEEKLRTLKETLEGEKMRLAALRSHQEELQIKINQQNQSLKNKEEVAKKVEEKNRQLRQKISESNNVLEDLKQKHQEILRSNDLKSQYEVKLRQLRDYIPEHLRQKCPVRLPTD